MAYDFYLGGILLPVTPGQLKISINGQNKTFNLINEGEINVLKKAGLSDVSFKVLLPNYPYPFAQYIDGFKRSDYYLDHFEKLKVGQKPFQFIVARTFPGGASKVDLNKEDLSAIEYNESSLGGTNMKVSLEEYTIEENAKEGLDIMVDVSLKQYQSHGSTKITIKPISPEEKPQGTAEQKRESEPEKITVGSKVIITGRLHIDSYGQGPGKTLNGEHGKVNIINEKGSHPYHVTNMSGGHLGWVLKSCVVGVK
ncbi:MAG: hydrolase [Eubacterium sp.]|jgi:hypothetical protein|nr:hydrolase [Eubacterium sp.]